MKKRINEFLKNNKFAVFGVYTIALLSNILLFPIYNNLAIAILAVYLLFLVLYFKIEGKYLAFCCVVLLVLSVVVSLIGYSDIAETLASWSYIFLSIGVIVKYLLR